MWTALAYYLGKKLLQKKIAEKTGVPGQLIMLVGIGGISDFASVAAVVVIVLAIVGIIFSAQAAAAQECRNSSTVALRGNGAAIAAQAAYGAGFTTRELLIEAVATAGAESSYGKNPVGDNGGGNFDYGMWQINGEAHKSDWASDIPRITNDNAYNAQALWEISKHGTDYTPWCTHFSVPNRDCGHMGPSYNDPGAPFQGFVAQATEAVDQFLAARQTGAAAAPGDPSAAGAPSASPSDGGAGTATNPDAGGAPASAGVSASAAASAGGAPPTSCGGGGPGSMPVTALTSGTALVQGTTVVVLGDDKIARAYAGITSVSVKDGQTVKAGDTLGSMETTGGKPTAPADGIAHVTTKGTLSTVAITGADGAVIVFENLENVQVKDGAAVTKDQVLGDVPARGDANLVAGAPMSCQGLTVARGYGQIPAGGYGGAGKIHHGIDLDCPAGTPEVAIANGVFHRNPTPDGYGNEGVVDTGQGILHIYGHMDSYAAEEGQQVKPGDVLGYEGSTGDSTGPHLHFEVDQGTGLAGTAQNPCSVFPPGYPTPAWHDQGCPYALQ